MEVDLRKSSRSSKEPVAGNFATYLSERVKKVRQEAAVKNQSVTLEEPVEGVPSTEPRR